MRNCRRCRSGPAKTSDLPKPGTSFKRVSFSASNTPSMSLRCRKHQEISVEPLHCSPAHKNNLGDEWSMFRSLAILSGSDSPA